ATDVRTERGVEPQLDVTGGAGHSSKLLQVLVGHRGSSTRGNRETADLDGEALLHVVRDDVREELRTLLRSVDVAGEAVATTQGSGRVASTTGGGRHREPTEVGLQRSLGVVVLSKALEDEDVPVAHELHRSRTGGEHARRRRRALLGGRRGEVRLEGLRGDERLELLTSVNPARVREVERRASGL